MPSHFSSIGFPVASKEEFVTLARRLMPDTRAVPVKEGRYLVWGDSGEQVWLQVDPENHLIGMNPHFGGKGSVRVATTSWVRRDGDTALDGALQAWAAPENDDPESGDYPFVFDVPDAAIHEDLVLPSTVDVQVAAFAHQATFYESPEAYYASQDAGRTKFASQSFIPSGMFIPGGEETVPPRAMAIFTGHVLEAAVRTNADTGSRFHWALVETLGGTYDVVVDPEVLPDVPVVGGVLSGTFWLSGRLAS